MCGCVRVRMKHVNIPSCIRVEDVTGTLSEGSSDLDRPRSTDWNSLRCSHFHKRQEQCLTCGNTSKVYFFCLTCSRSDAHYQKKCSVSFTL